MRGPFRIQASTDRRLITQPSGACAEAAIFGRWTALSTGLVVIALAAEANIDEIDVTTINYVRGESPYAAGHYWFSSEVDACGTLSSQRFTGRHPAPHSMHV